VARNEESIVGVAEGDSTPVEIDADIVAKGDSTPVEIDADIKTSVPGNAEDTALSISRDDDNAKSLADGPRPNVDTNPVGCWPSAARASTKI
jgi:hypothetical protein